MGDVDDADLQKLLAEYDLQLDEEEVSSPLLAFENPISSSLTLPVSSSSLVPTISPFLSNSGDGLLQDDEEEVERQASRPLEHFEKFWFSFCWRCKM